MRVAIAPGPFFFDVNDFPRAAHITVPADDAPAGECCKAEESNDAHGGLRRPFEAIPVPRQDAMRQPANLHSYVNRRRLRLDPAVTKRGRFGSKFVTLDGGKSAERGVVGGIKRQRLGEVLGR